MRNAFVRAVTALSILLVSAAAAAQAYPTKPIRIISPWTAGGPAEALARVVTTKMSERLGQPFVIDSRPGANGMILNMMADIETVHVPYKGSAPILVDLMGGRIDMAFVGISGSLQQARAGSGRSRSARSSDRTALPTSRQWPRRSLASSSIRGTG